MNHSRAHPTALVPPITLSHQKAALRRLRGGRWVGVHVQCSGVSCHYHPVPPCCSCQVLTIYLSKQAGMEWWDCVAEGEPKIGE